MVIALLALAVAMIAGGLVAVVQGYDIVLLERGWTLVISGSVCATGGALLIGLTMVLFRLGRIQAELVRTRDRMGQAQPGLPPSEALESMPAVSSGLLARGTGVSSSMPGVDGDEQPTLPLFMRRDREDENEPAADAAPERDEAPVPTATLPDVPARNDNRVPRLNLPRYLFGGRDKREAEEPEAAADEPDFDADEPEFDLGRIARESERKRRAENAGNLVFPPVTAEGRAREEAGDREEARDREGARDLEEDQEPSRDEERGGDNPPSSVRAVSDTAPARDERKSEPDDDGDLSRPESQRSVVGTYNSGDNRYVMFSDGSIEAETPEGLFRFSSLDELKDFIASGGERRSGSAPTT
jgi:hypothetical protein